MVIDDVKISTLKRIKEVKEQNGFTIRHIADLLSEKGYSISESTLKSIFAPNSDVKKHRYHDTIAPLADVLLDAYVKDNSKDDEAFSELLREKVEHIDALVVRLNELETDYRKRIDYLKAQCERLEKRLDEREETNKRLLDLITNSLK